MIGVHEWINVKSNSFARIKARWFGQRKCLCVGYLLMFSAAIAFADGIETPPYSFTEYNFVTEKSGPSIVTIDRSGSVWVAMARAGKIGRWENGNLREYNLPAGAFPVGLTLDSHGRVWYSDIRRNKIGRLDPVTGANHDFAIPTADSWPFFLVIDRQGAIWFTERMGNNVGRLDPRTGRVVEFPVPTKNCQPAGMTISPEGEIFFTENSGNKVGWLDPTTGKIAEYVVPTPMTPSPFYGLAGIASDRAGNIWFAEVDGRLGLLRHLRTQIEEIPVPEPAARPAGVTVDRWGIVWFTELDGNCISSYDPVFREFRRYPIPTGHADPKPMGPPETTARGEIPQPGFTARTSRPFGIAVDHEGRIWFSEQYAHKLGTLIVPALDIFGPRGSVSTRSVEVMIRARLTGSSSSRQPFPMQYQIDGHDVIHANLVDTTLLAPGAHIFSVTAFQDDGKTTTASSTFMVRPTIAVVQQLLERTPGARISPTIKSVLEKSFLRAVQKTRQGDTVEARHIVKDVITILEQRRSGPASALDELLLADLHYMDQFGAREYTVDILDKHPYFRPSHLTIEVGDEVTFRYHGTSHCSMGRKSTLVAWRNGDFPSINLPPCGSWSHRYDSEGDYPYLSLRHRQAAGRVVVLSRTTAMREFPLPGNDRIPGVMSIDRDDNVWFTEGGGGFLQLSSIPLNNKIGKISPDGKLTEYSTPTLESGPTSIHVGKEGHVWFTERGGNKIGELDPQTGAIREYEIPTPMSVATGITVDPAGKIWYAGKLSSKVGVLDSATGKIVEYDTPTPKSQPSTIIADDAGAIWFDERANDRIVRLDPNTGKMKEFSVPTAGSRVVGILPGRGGTVWFLELGANKVGELHPETGLIVEHAIPTPFSSPFKEALDQEGRLWFTEVFGNKIGVLDKEQFFEFAIPTKQSMPGGIAVDSKGNLWFTEQAANKVAMIPHGGTTRPQRMQDNDTATPETAK